MPARSGRRQPRGRRPTRRACARATRSWRSTAAATWALPNLIAKGVAQLGGAGASLPGKRPGHDGLIDLDLQPRREANADRPTIGILPSDSLEIGDFLAPPGMADPADLSRRSKARNADRRSTSWSRPVPPVKSRCHSDRSAWSTIACSPSIADRADHASHRTPADLAIRRARPGASSSSS